MAASEVKESRYVGRDEEEESDDEADDDEMALASDRTDTIANDETMGQPVRDEVGPWPFPKAADFAVAFEVATESVEGGEQPAQHRDDEPLRKPLHPALAWPFPPSNPDTLLRVRHAA
jgi:ParB family chromosome partitioning protein